MTEGYDSNKTISKFTSPNKLSKPLFTFKNNTERPVNAEIEPNKILNSSFEDGGSHEDANQHTE